MAGRLRIRMYRTGFGDCFLLSFGRTATARHVLIDFGAHMHGEIGTMQPIMDNIETVTKRTLDVVIATHAHRDHISGFGKFAQRFAEFTIGEVWLPWTDSDEPEAVALRRKQLALYDRLDAHLRLALDGGQPSPRVAAALHALSNLRGNEVATSALANGFDTGATVRYLRGGDSLPRVGRISGLSARILGPPKDRAFLSRMDPPSDQRFLTGPTDTSGVVRPFPLLETRSTDADFRALVAERQPEVPPNELERLKELAEAPADRLALALDSVRNNTSLVILFRYKAGSLLFPGDAQWGNWQSWIGTDDARQLLGQLDFLKVAHHGSENATPVDVVRALRESGIAAMVSTQGTPFPTIPRLPLLTELEKHCTAHVAVRSDWIDVDGAPPGPRPRPKLPKGFTPGALWVDFKM